MPNFLEHLLIVLLGLVPSCYLEVVILGSESTPTAGDRRLPLLTLAIGAVIISLALKFLLLILYKTVSSSLDLLDSIQLLPLLNATCLCAPGESD